MIKVQSLFRFDTEYAIYIAWNSTENYNPTLSTLQNRNMGVQSQTILLVKILDDNYVWKYWMIMYSFMIWLTINDIILLYING